MGIDAQKRSTWTTCTRITEPGEETKHPEHAAAVNCESTLARRQDAFPRPKIPLSSFKKSESVAPPIAKHGDGRRAGREEGRGNLGGNFALPSPSENEGILSLGSIHKGLPR